MLQTPGRSNQLPELANNDVETAPQMCASDIRTSSGTRFKSQLYLPMYSLHISLFALFLHVVTHLDGFDSWLFPLRVLNYWLIL